MKNKSAIIHSSLYIIHLFLLGSCKEETKTQTPATTEQSVVPVQLAKVEQTVRAEHRRPEGFPRLQRHGGRKKYAREHRAQLRFLDRKSVV